MDMDEVVSDTVEAEDADEETDLEEEAQIVNEMEDDKTVFEELKFDAAVEEAPRKRARHGNAWAYLQGQAIHSQSSLSSSAKKILHKLLKKENCLSKSKMSSDGEMSNVLKLVSQANQKLMDKRTVIDESSSKSMRDLEIVKQADQLSYLGSFLAVLEIELKKGSSVPARVLLKRSCLAIPPKDIPASLDSEEMAMAALEFLSSSFNASSSVNNSELKPANLPLIRPVAEENDIKKRSYAKCGEWKFLDDIAFQQKVMALESRFLTNGSSFKYLKRIAFCPPTLEGDGDLDFLLRKGKHKVVVSNYKRKPAGSKAKAATKSNPDEAISLGASSPS